jgi:hypothetical protein
MPANGKKAVNVRRNHDCPSAAVFELWNSKEIRSDIVDREREIAFRIWFLIKFCEISHQPIQ